MRLIEREKNFMSTIISIKVVQNTESTIAIQDAIEKAFYEFERIVKKYTRFNENSELSNLNRQSGSWVKVSEEFFSLIELMLKIYNESKGAFDPTVIDFLEVYGYDKNYDFSKLNNPDLDNLVKKIATKRPKFNEVELNKKEHKIKLIKNQRIDLGGIGKGYAVDKAFERLSEVSNNFLIDAGGDIRAVGLNNYSNKWTVGLKIHNNEIIQNLEVDNIAVCSSGSWIRKVKQFHHIINPVSGEPHRSKYKTVFCIANTATIADAWATAFFILGPDNLNLKPKEVHVKFV